MILQELPKFSFSLNSVQINFYKAKEDFSNLEKEFVIQEDKAISLIKNKQNNFINFFDEFLKKLPGLHIYLHKFFYRLQKEFEKEKNNSIFMAKLQKIYEDYINFNIQKRYKILNYEFLLGEKRERDEETLETDDENEPNYNEKKLKTHSLISRTPNKKLENIIPKIRSSIKIRNKNKKLKISNNENVNNTQNQITRRKNNIISLSESSDSNINIQANNKINDNKNINQKINLKKNKNRKIVSKENIKKKKTKIIIDTENESGEDSKNAIRIHDEISVVSNSINNSNTSSNKNNKDANKTKNEIKNSKKNKKKIKKNIIEKFQFSYPQKNLIDFDDKLLQQEKRNHLYYRLPTGINSRFTKTPMIQRKVKKHNSYRSLGGQKILEEIKKKSEIEIPKIKEEKKIENENENQVGIKKEINEEKVESEYGISGIINRMFKSDESHNSKEDESNSNLYKIEVIYGRKRRGKKYKKFPKFINIPKKKLDMNIVNKVTNKEDASEILCQKTITSGYLSNNGSTIKLNQASINRNFQTLYS